MIKIFTFGSHRTDFIRLQDYSFRRHLREDFRFIVFNNALFDSAGGADYNGIHAAGREVGATIIDIQKDKDLIDRCQRIELSCTLFNHAGLYSNVNVAHAYAFCWAWENVIAKEKGAIAILDSDVFLIMPTKLTDTLYPHQLCGIPDGRRHPDGRVFHYIWPRFVLADMDRLPDPTEMNWWCGRIHGVPVDVGGQNYHYFQTHPDLDKDDVRCQHSSRMEGPNVFAGGDYDEFYLKDATVLHYRSGSNWNHQTNEFHQ